MRNENITRRVDSLGRIVLPKHLRVRGKIGENDEVDIFTEEIEGRYFICVAKSGAEDPRYKIARDLLMELGVEIPNELITEYCE